MMMRDQPLGRRIARGLSGLGGRLVVLAAFALAGCSGGGGGGSGPGRPPAFFETEEYFASGGLDAIDAAAAYADGASGEGVLVGVVDTGVDRDHPELRGAIDPRSIDIVSGDPAAVDDADGHGTAVAGIIAARRNAALGHGVAFGASILAIRADALNSCSQGCSFTEADVAAATEYAVGRNARVVNYSLGGAPSIGPRLAGALAAAADAGALLVFAAGNAGADEPTFPGRVVGGPALRGRALAVGSIGRDGEISAFSNRAGTLADSFLVAPGEGLLAPQPGGGAARVTGTSFAAPHVSGAAALLLDAAPFLSAREVVDLLLSTATDLGAPGPDPVYGHGLLDLDRALQPQGRAVVPSGGPGAAGLPLEASRLTTGSAFGPGVDLPPFVFLDGYGRPYWTAAEGRVRGARERFPLERWMAPGRSSDLRLMAGPAVTSTLRLTEGGERAEPGWRPDLVEPAAGGVSASFATAGGLRVDAADGGAGLLATGIADRWTADAAGLMAAGRFQPAHAGLAADGPAVAVGQAADGVGLTVALAAGGRERGGGGERLAAAQLDLEDERERRLSIQVGRLEEPGGPLGSRGGGALRTGPATTSFVAVGGRWPVDDRLTAFGQIGLGRTSLGSAGGLLGDADLTSVGAAIGIARAQILTADDRLTVGLAQPLRVEGGRAVYDRPVGRDASGAILRDRSRIGLEPEGREVDLELGYETGLPAVGRLAFNWLTRLEPGHDPDAPPEHLLAVRLKRRW